MQGGLIKLLGQDLKKLLVCPGGKLEKLILPKAEESTNCPAGLEKAARLTVVLRADDTEGKVWAFKSKATR